MPKHGTPNSAPPQDPTSAQAQANADGVVTAPLVEGDTTPNPAVAAARESFDDVPTVSDRRKRASETPPPDPTPGIGAYRLVRPRTSDTITPPPMVDTITPAPQAKRPRRPSRLVLGVPRK